ncbi:tryptophan--tRNA ligase [Haloarcula laminariae]|uniref:tryptophan--tRNA ligase n=1 Tax=Haloarcula laminariae TaxID=2961577 RepID=UPI0021C5E3F0|nr:tryptophan--tRNA ligase [Halomicroarcula laminariae]
MTDRDSHHDDASPDEDRRQSGAAWRESEPTPVTDGGTDAAGADEAVLDPWGSSTVEDYRKLFEQFGIEEFDDVLPEVPNPHYLMRRGVIFGHRDYSPVAEAMRNDDPFASLSGFMPTGDPHIGHKMVFDEIIWHQQQGADAYALIADLEAHAARELSWSEIDEHARSYVLSLLALGFDPEEGELYRQSDNRQLQDLAFELGAETNFSELQAIYDFDGETDVSHMQSVVTQMADILYPQLDEPKPTVIPVGPDQDPHMRLARDLAARMRYFGVTEAFASFEADAVERTLLRQAYDAREEYAEDPETPRCVEAADYLREREPAPADARESVAKKLDNAGKEPLRPRTRIFDRNATDEAFEALIEAVPGEKRVYDEHVDAFELDRADADELAREVELDTGGYGFLPPSSIYHRFMTGLTGGKMSSSIPASHISLLDDPEDGYDKVKSATTGGRTTAEEQREKGGKADECPVYELYAYLLSGDDDEFAEEVYEECVGGERLCGGCKEQAAELMEAFLEEHQEKRDEWEEKLDELDIDLDSDRKRA